MLCLEGFPIRGETAKEGVKESNFGLMGSRGSGRRSGRGRKRVKTALMEGGNETAGDERGCVRFFEPGVKGVHSLMPTMRLMGMGALQYVEGRFLREATEGAERRVPLFPACQSETDC